MDEWKVYRRVRAHQLRKEGKSVDFVCRELHCNHAFVNKWHARGLDGKGFLDSQRSGSPRKLPSALEAKAKRLLKHKREGSADKVAKRLRLEDGIDISGRSIQRFAKGEGMKSYIRPIKARLFPKDKELRVAFAKRRRRRHFWKKVWWTDEKVYELHSENRRIWAERREDVPPREKDLVEKTVRVWGGISAQGRTKLFKIQPNWNSPAYVQFLESKGLPSIENVAGTDYIFMHDGDGPHRGKKVQEFIEKRGLEILDDFPPRSGDLQPDENMWKIVDDGLKNRKFTTLGGLFKALTEEWERVPEETVVKLALSVPKRLREVIELGGSVTKH